jgi:hypothetical protein
MQREILTERNELSITISTMEKKRAGNVEYKDNSNEIPRHTSMIVARRIHEFC